MGSSGSYGRQPKVQQCVKLPASKYLRISDVTAEWFVDTGGSGDGRIARIVSPLDKNVWEITVGRDSKGSFLGDGWPQFVAEHCIGVGWYLVFKHEGQRRFTLKVFDNNFVIKPFARTITVLSQAEIKNAFARKPQFIVPLQISFKKKMPIPPEFLRRGYISEEDLNKQRPMASFLTKYHVELEKDGPNVFFAGSGWPRFLDNFDMSETDVLLIKYHGCMNFSLETFGHGNNGHTEEETCLSQESEQSPGAQSQEEEHVSTRKRKQSNCKTPAAQGQEGEHVSTRKRKQSNCKTPAAQGQEGEHISTPKTPKRKRSKGKRMLESPTTSGHLNKKTKCFELGSAGSQAWLKKKINSDSALKGFYLPGHFGYKKACKIMLKPVGRNKSWEVKASIFKRPNINSYRNVLVKGWSKFCKGNRLKKGDVCTFKVVNSMLWKVDIERC